MSTSEEHLEVPVANVYNNHDEWVGFFFRAGDAAKWIASRMIPEVFKIERGPRREGASPARGVYPQKGDPRLKDADEFGFVADKPWPKAKGKKSEPTVEVPLHVMTTSRSDDRILDEAIRESLATDKTDDTTREDIGLDI